MATPTLKTKTIFFPPEWYPQSAVMLTWPNAGNVWYPSLEAVEKQFVSIATEISKRERVVINCIDKACREHIHQLLEQADAVLSRVTLSIIPSTDVWARDHGPITVFENNQPKLLDFIFNGWGNKYPADEDNAVSRHMHEQRVFGNTPFEPINLVLEGGSIETDGKGTLLTTRSCLLSPERNPHLTAEAIEEQLKSYLGIHRILWLDNGYLAGDDTDGHIDTLARFCDANTICYVQCDDPTDEHFDALQAMEKELQQLRTEEGKPYRLVSLPWPGAKCSKEGHRLPATYANFLIINDAVLVPTYDDPADKVALERLKNCFPHREIVAVPCRHIIEQFGSLHCVTMQLPEGVVPS